MPQEDFLMGPVVKKFPENYQMPFQPIRALLGAMANEQAS